jgi:hypothetical protein
MDRNLFLQLMALFFLTIPINNSDQYYGSEKSQPKIRLICIKHSREHIADGDADLAIKAANSAAAKGLKIKVIGNYFVDGKMVVDMADPTEHIYDIETLSRYIKQYIKADAESGDTLIVFTIGHGANGGWLHNLGQRSNVMNIIAETAEQNKQKVFWWQLSCHASDGLPEINTLTTRQQDYFSMFASSAPEETSAAYVQGGIMEKIFNAIAEGNKSIDANEDGKISTKELRNFMNTIDKNYGNRVHAKTPEFVIFGNSGVHWLPIIDKNNKQVEYNEDYVLMPE